MPDRIIRDELLRSHRYRRLTSDTARLLFVHLLLQVDNFGNYEAHTIAIEDALCRPLGEETAAKLLQELADADLIRMYSVAGKRYLHIPRFRQRLRYLKGRHPAPPPEVECNEMKVLRAKVGLRSDCSLTVVSRSEEKRSEVNLKQGLQPVDNFQPAAAATHALASKLKGNTQTVGWWKTEAGIAAKGAEIGLPARNGETFAQWKSRIFDRINERTRA